MIKLPELPFEMDALEPRISKETLEFHYSKHHQTYVTKLNWLIPWTEFENMELDEIVKKSSGWIFNNAAQIWNHTFYWNCLTSENNSDLKWKILDLIIRDFSSVDNFKTEFVNSAINNFGSWWTWLVLNTNDKLEIVNTSNAETTFTDSKYKTLLTCDVWEHAYYIDYRNVRPDYLNNYWELINWEFVNNNIK